MKIRVDIECESISDFYSHLSELRRQIKKETKRLKLTPEDEFTNDVDLYDDNCYGTHDVEVLPSDEQGAQGSDTTKADSINSAKSQNVPKCDKLGDISNSVKDKEDTPVDDWKEKFKEYYFFNCPNEYEIIDWIETNIKPK
jgi:hypothetical protein